MPHAEILIKKSGVKHFFPIFQRHNNLSVKWFLPQQCENLQLFCVIYENKLGVFVFWAFVWTKEAV